MGQLRAAGFSLGCAPCQITDAPYRGSAGVPLNAELRWSRRTLGEDESAYQMVCLEDTTQREGGLRKIIGSYPRSSRGSTSFHRYDHSRSFQPNAASALTSFNRNLQKLIDRTIQMSGEGRCGANHCVLAVTELNRSNRRALIPSEPCWLAPSCGMPTSSWNRPTVWRRSVVPRAARVARPSSSSVAA